MPKQFWWIGVVGLPAAVCGIGFIALAAGKLLPDRIREGRIEPGGREYTVETLVSAKSPIVGQSIEQAGLRSLPGLYLVEIERAGDRLPAVAPGERIEAGDRLVFAGVVESVVDLLTTRGLEPATQEVRKVDAARRERHRRPFVKSGQVVFMDDSTAAYDGSHDASSTSAFRVIEESRRCRRALSVQPTLISRVASGPLPNGRLWAALGNPAFSTSVDCRGIMRTDLGLKNTRFSRVQASGCAGSDV